jgi:hypothetical protein
MRAALLAGSVAVSATSAFADEKLPITGVFGNPPGCAMANDMPYERKDSDNEDALFLTPENYGAMERSCSFKWISEPDSPDFMPSWIVIALCGGEESTWPGIYAIRDWGDRVEITSVNAPADGFFLPRCP